MLRPAWSVEPSAMMGTVTLGWPRATRGSRVLEIWLVQLRNEIHNLFSIKFKWPHVISGLVLDAQAQPLWIRVGPGS